jgi:hypothetical protein
MTQHDSLKVRVLTLPKNFTYAELVKLLNGFGYKEEERGRSSGSAVMFYNKAMNDKIMFHKTSSRKGSEAIHLENGY